MKKKKKSNDSYKTFSSFIDNKDSHIIHVLKHMSAISKNIHNITIYIYTIFLRYKELIFKQIDDDIEYKKIKNINEAVCKFNAMFGEFYDLHSQENSKIKSNHDVFYNIVINQLNGKHLINSNFSKLKKQIMSKCKLDHPNEFNNKYESTLIIERILKNLYLKNYYNTLKEIKNHEPVTINDDDFINDVKNDICLFDEESNKLNITKRKGFKDFPSNENLVTRFIYTKLGENKEKIPSDMIINIIAKVFKNFSSYFNSKQNGIKCKFPKYKQTGELFILPFYERSFRINDNVAKLTLGKNVASNYPEITKNKDLICVQENKLTNKYIDKKFMTEISKKEKIYKKDNFIKDNTYVAKTDKNIINSAYGYFKIPEKISNKKIKLIEITNMYDGYRFKINYVYEVESENKKIDIKKVESDNCISIDLGVNNLMTIYDPTGKQKIIGGKYIVSLNEHYNKKIDDYRSKQDKSTNEEQKKLHKNMVYKTEIKRQNKINDYFNRAVKYLHNVYNNKKELIIVGYNENWKNEINMGRKNNRKFYGIPYAKLLTKLKNKFGGKLIKTEESYTSKCDGMALEKVEKKKEYMGERIKRGLFQSSVGKLINADINGAINIMRKVVKIEKVKGINICNPERIKLVGSKKKYIQ